MKRFSVFFLCIFAACAAFADDFKTTDGKEYKNVTVTKVEPDGLTIESDSGIEKIPFAVLSKEIQQKYNYDPAKEAAFRKSESDAWIQKKIHEDPLLYGYLAPNDPYVKSYMAEMQTASDNRPPAAPVDPDLDDKIEKAVIPVGGKVLSVSDDGILITDVMVGFKSDGADYHAVVDGQIFIYGAHGYVDGDAFAGNVYPAPIYHYDSVLGAARTVRAFAVTKELAKQLIIKASAPQ